MARVSWSSCWKTASACQVTAKWSRRLSSQRSRREPVPGLLGQGEDRDQERTGRTQPSVVKPMMDGDSFRVRNLYQTGGTVEVTFKIITICNIIPMINRIEDAVASRVRMIPFKTKWVVDAPEDLREQVAQRIYKQETKIDNRIETLGPAFMWFLARHWKEHKNVGIEVVPPEVEESTRKYINSCRTVHTFFNDCIMLDDSECSLTVIMAYSTYKDWMQMVERTTMNCYGIDHFQKDNQRNSGRRQDGQAENENSGPGSRTLQEKTPRVRRPTPVPERPVGQSRRMAEVRSHRKNSSDVAVRQ